MQKDKKKRKSTDETIHHSARDVTFVIWSWKQAISRSILQARFCCQLGSNCAVSIFCGQIQVPQVQPRIDGEERAMLASCTELGRSPLGSMPSCCLQALL